MIRTRWAIVAVGLAITAAGCSAPPQATKAPTTGTNPPPLALVCPTGERSDLLIDSSLGGAEPAGEPDPIAVAVEFAKREFRLDDVRVAGSRRVVGDEQEGLTVYLARPDGAPRYEVTVTKLAPGRWTVTAAESCG